jgi:protein arginine kinase activator
MKVHCERCGKEATVHLTEISSGQKTEKHLCEECAAAEGITIKAHVPLAKLLEGLGLQSAAEKELARLKCDVCGISFLEFRQQQLLGCPNDYRVFEEVLAPLLERAHEGASVHAGKVPANAAQSERRQNELLRLRGRLKEAIAREDYEEAAELRDRIKTLEGS